MAASRRATPRLLGACHLWYNADMASAPSPSRWNGWILGLLVGVLTLEVVRAAWLCDDAYITFRTVDNLTSGLGATWNPSERVQVYTHPLWMLLLSAATWILPSIYAVGLALGLATSLAAALVFARHVSGSLSGKALGLMALIGSKAYVDYSTSGLENPLVHLLLFATLCAAARLEDPRRNALWVALGTALIALTRMDLLVLLGPLLVTSLWRAGREAPRALALGFAPLLAWEFISVLYYGFPFPNTAYSKLGSGLPAGELAGQGLAYLANSFANDPLTLLVIAAGIGAALLKPDRISRPVALGLALQLPYTVKIGGDFMSGRFLTPALAAAAFLLARAPWGARSAWIAFTFALGLALATERSPLRASTAYGSEAPPPEHIDERGIADERAYWHHYTGLWSPSRKDLDKPHVTRGYRFGERLREQGPQVLVANGMGFVGYFAGPEVHLVDPMGLGDALCARLPIWRAGVLLAPAENAFRERPWRIGHYYRQLPEGYLESLETGVLQIRDASLAEYVRQLHLVTRGPLFDSARLKTILNLNLLQEEHLIEEYLDRQSPPADPDH